MSTSYYVMHCIDGDECLLHNRPTYDEAVKALNAEHSHNPRADLSIWDSRGGMLAVMDRAGVLRKVGV